MEYLTNNALATTDPILRAQNVGLVYRTGNTLMNPALLDLTLDVFSFECVCILGQSSCGKTSLLNLLGGFILPTQGHIFFRNSLVTEPNILCGRIFQNSALFPWRTVSGNLTSGSQIRRLSKPERQIEVNALLASLQLLDCAQLYPYQLSGGNVPARRGGSGDSQ